MNEIANFQRGIKAPSFVSAAAIGKQQTQPKDQPNEGKKGDKTTKATKLKKVGEYIFIKQIGSGSYSTVHQGRHQVTLKKVAIKMIPSTRLDNKTYNRVVSEIKILRSLVHKNIVKILDFKKTSQNYYLIFEFCSNGDLETYIKRHYDGKMSETLCQQVVFQVADAFRLLSSHKIVHRDLKLANILVNEDFTIKIADFGFAKHNQDDDLLRSTLGTPITMAPEILFGQQYNEKCDIWSLGVIIFQMVYGKPPFMPVRGSGITGLIKEIKKEVLEFPTSIQISDVLKNLLRQMLQVNPQKRIDFTELFQMPWISGAFKPGQKETIGKHENEELDLTQSLKMRKEISVNKRGLSNDKLRVEEEEEEELEEDEEEEDQKLQIRNKTAVEDTLTPPASAIASPPVESKDTTQLASQPIQVIEDGKIALAYIKLAQSMRKHYEKRVIVFLATYNKHNGYFKEIENSLDFSDQSNEYFNLAAFLSVLVVAQRIKVFLEGKLMVQVEEILLDFGTYSQFLSTFLKNGEDDLENYTIILAKKLKNLQEIIGNTYKKLPQVNISDSNSPDYLLISTIAKAISQKYSQQQQLSEKKCEQDSIFLKRLCEMCEISETIRLPSLELHMQFRKNTSDSQSGLGQGGLNKNKYTRHSKPHGEMQLGLMEQTPKEKEFSNLQKQLMQLLTYHSQRTQIQE